MPKNGCPFTKGIFVLYGRDIISGLAGWRRAEESRRRSRRGSGLRMPKLKPETMAARRDEILQAAAACFARQGFHQTTIADVIAESGLSAGCIYGHFAGKEELIQAIGEQRHARDAALLAVARDSADPLDGLRAIAR